MNTTLNLAEWTERLPERPEIFPHALDLIADRVLLVELSEDEVRAASFLDQRVLGPARRGSWVAWRQVADSMKGHADSEPPGFIFHVGHCGSTLLSRLLEFAEGTRSLREPLPLRSLAQDLADAGAGRSLLSREEQLERLRVLCRMWRRGAAHTVIKATSICTGLLTQLQAFSPPCRSVFIYNRLETHVATLLAGQNALTDLKGFAQLRLQRLQQKTGLEIELCRLSLPQLAVLGWLSETTSVVDAMRDHAAQIAVLEFDSLLADPGGALAMVLAHLKLPSGGGAIENALRSPVLRTYSKAPEHSYDAGTRKAILADARSRFGREIKSALGWAEEVAGRDALVAASLQKFA